MKLNLRLCYHTAISNRRDRACDISHFERCHFVMYFYMHIYRYILTGHILPFSVTLTHANQQ